MNYRHILMASLAATALTACEKELDFRYNEIEPLTVIEAQLTPEGAKVAVTLTTPMAEPIDSTRLTDASVTLYDLSAGTSTLLTPDTEGYYTSPLQGIAGHEYSLAVERHDRLHEARTAMYPATEITSLEFSWIRMPYDHVAVLQCKYRDVPHSEGLQYYWIKLYRNGSIYRWATQDSRGASDGICTFTAMTTRKDTSEEDADDVLYDGDVVTCTVCPVSKELHDYLEALRNGSNGPALFTGERCLGYFMATSPVSASVVFRPDDLPLQE